MKRLAQLIAVIYLLWVGIPAFAQCPATDSFSGTGPLNSSNWTQTTLTSGVSTLDQASGDAFPVTASTYGQAIWKGAACSPGNAQYAKVKINAVPTGVTGPMVRSDANGNGYIYDIREDTIFSFVSGAYFATVTFCPAHVVGHIYELAAYGFYLAVYDLGTTGASSTLFCSGIDHYSLYPTGAVGIYVDRTKGTSDTLSDFEVGVSPLAPVTIAPNAGIYTSLTVTLTASAGNVICYTTDGSTPTAPTPGTCSGGTTQTYTAPFSQATSATITALATESGFTNSPTTQAAYTIRAAETWYIRLDGGDNTRCTGLVNAPDPGSGSAQPCAYNHPAQMQASDGTWAALAAGDTIQFEDLGPYYIGEQNNGVGTDWHSQLPGICPAPNTDGNACILPAFPDNTSILGLHADSCHNSTHTALVNPTVLSGINNLFAIATLQGTDHVTMKCIEMTQPDVCTFAGFAANVIDFTSVSGGFANYTWHYPGFGNYPVVAELVNVKNTTNDGGALNVTGGTIAANNFSTYSITGAQVTSSTTAVLTYTLATGEKPIVGQSLFSVSGLTSSSGSQVNTSFGFYGGGIASSITAVTGTTFTITLASPFWTIAAFGSESGSSTNLQSGVFTVAMAGSVGQTAETGVMNPTGSCTQANNFAQTGIIFEFDVAKGPSNFDLEDIAMIGLSRRGILGSDINTTGSDVSTESDIYIIGSGYTGQDADGGGCNTSCESVGTLNANYIDIEFSGCVAATRVPAVLSNTFNYCYTQNSNGQGDGWVTIASGDFTLNVTHSNFLYNMQDGFDSLHLSDDDATSPEINISTSWSEGNLGQTFKLGAGAASSAINNRSVGNCRVTDPAQHSTLFSSFPSGWNAGINSADVCRADGDEWAFQLDDGTVLTLENNTSVGYGATMYDYTCAFSFPNCVSSGGATFVFRNNISKGYVDPASGQLAAGFFSTDGDVFANAGSSINHNIWDTMRVGSGCGQIPEETNCLSVDPLLVSESDVDAINPNLTSSSPAIRAGTTPAPSTDYNGIAQTSPPTIGAFVFGGSPPSSGGTVITGNGVVSGTVTY